MSKITDAVASLAAAPAAALGLEIWDVEFVREAGTRYLRIYIDRDGGVTLDDCGELSDKIDSILEMENLIDGAYILEVSSPGVHRVLKKPAHYKRFVNERVKVILKTPLNGLGFFTGNITAADDTGFTLADGSNTYRFEYDNIKKATLDPVLEF